MRIRPRRGNEQGSILLLTLVFIALFGIVVGVMLSFGRVGLQLHSGEASRSHGLYAADGAIQDAVSLTQANSGRCPTSMDTKINPAGQNFGTGSGALPMSLPSDVPNVNVKCQQYTGPGSNLFGGYALIAGVNVNQGSHIANPGQETVCKSISSDPIGGGTSTFAHASTPTCLDYPAAPPPTPWVLQNPPPTTAPYTGTPSLAAAFTLDTSNKWFVGNDIDPAKSPVAWYFDGDEYDVATGTGLNAGAALNSVWAANDPVDDSHIWIGGTVGTTGTVWYSTNANATGIAAGPVKWTATGPLTSAKTITSVWGTDESHIWAVGQTTTGFGVWFSADGTTWSGPTNLAGATALQGVWATPDASQVWAAGQSGFGIWGTQASGVSGALNSSSAKDAGHMWAVGANCTVLYLNGNSWISQTVPSGVCPTGSNLTGVDATSGSPVVVGSNGSNAVSFACTGPSCTTATPAWTTKTLPAGFNVALTAVSQQDATHMWAVGAPGTGAGNPCTVLFSSSIGGAWASDSTGTTACPNGTTLNGVAANGGKPYIVGPGALLAVCPAATCDASGTWTKITISGLSGTPDLYGVDANTKGGAAGPAVAVGASGTIVTCSAHCDGSAPGATFAAVSATNTSVTLRSVSQLSNTAMLAVGDNGTVDQCTASCNLATATWTAKSSTTTQQLNGVTFLDATDAWAVGANGTIVTSSNQTGAVWSTTNNATWTGTEIPNTSTLNDIHGVNANAIWAVGTGGASGAVASWNGSSWNAATQFSKIPPDTPGFIPTKEFLGVVAVDATHAWVVGDNGNHAGDGVVMFCNGAASTCTTTGQDLPPNTVPLKEIGGVPSSPSPVLDAVGGGGTILTYAPTQNALDCSTPPTKCLAAILGGPVFNGNALNLPSTLSVGGGDFIQYDNPPAVPCKPIPQNLIMSNGFQYNCVSSPAIPKAITDLTNPNTLDTKPLPSSVPPNALHNPSNPLPAGCSALPCLEPASPAEPTCPGYYVYTPGTYSATAGFPNITLKKNFTYFFESGVYNFQNGWPHLDNGATGTDNLYIIGGRPSPGDVVTLAKNSPCWKSVQTTVQNGGFWDAGSGTGVEFILAGPTWWDVHTVNLELFTRERDPASNAAAEGAQGISLREVSPCLPTGCNGWVVSNPGGVNQLFQVDANNHVPHVYVHGGMYLPNHNLEEYTQTQPVVLGPIWANSVEFSFQSKDSPELSVSGGSPGTPTVVLTATAGTVTVQAFIPFDTTQNPPVEVTDPNQGYYWRVLNPS